MMQSQSQTQNQSQVPVMMPPGNVGYVQMAPVTQYHQVAPMAHFSQMPGYPVLHQVGSAFPVMATPQMPQMSQMTQLPQMQSFGYFQNPHYTTNFNNFLTAPSNFAPQVPVTYQTVGYPHYGLNPSLPLPSYQ
jgi:hypothetical protein